MPFEDNKILEVNQYQKSDKAPFDICRDIECVIEDIDRYTNTHENLSATNVSGHQIFQCLKYHHLQVLKGSMIYKEVKIV